ncbi:MAG: BamA/TamA family outer membrane protein [Balneolales bacterium]
MKWLDDVTYKSLPDSLGIMPDEADSAHHLNLVKRHILETFSEEGYFSGRIDSLTTKSNDLHIYTTRGYRFILSTFDINYAGSLETTEKYPPRLKSGAFYSQNAVELEINRIIKHYESLGFPLISVEIEKFVTDPSNNSVHIDLCVNTNGRMRAAGIKTSKLERNTLVYLEKASGVRNEDIITPELMLVARRNLENTGLFEYVSEPDILVRGDENFLYFDLNERSTNAFDVLIGYVPQQDGDNTIVGTGKIRVRNALWQGSTLDLAFERLRQDVTSLDMALNRNWIMDIPLGMGGSFNFLQQDSSYQVRNLKVNSSWYLSSALEISVSLRRESTSANANPELPVRVLNGNATLAGVGLHYSNVDNRVSPTTGIELLMNLETGVKRTTDSRSIQYTPNKNLGQQEVNLRVRPYFNPFFRQVVALSLNGFYKESPEFTESDLFRFGGTKSIRGYREDQFYASRFAWGDLEYRYLLDEASYGFLFGAYGMYHRPQLITEPDLLNQTSGNLYSWGFGFSYSTPIGFMQFTYALSPEESFTNGKIHFGITKDW